MHLAGEMRNRLAVQLSLQSALVLIAKLWNITLVLTLQQKVFSPKVVSEVFIRASKYKLSGMPLDCIGFAHLYVRFSPPLPSPKCLLLPVP